MTDAVPAAPAARETVVNDFQINVATVNGTGSQTSNILLIRSLFRMGIPVNGKNLFPSNIKGLQTWYTIRVSKDSYIARIPESEILVAMNAATIIEDVKEVPSGGVCLYDTGLKYEPTRDDILLYPMPVDDLIGETDTPRALKERVRNMVYVGALAYLLGIDLDVIDNALLKALKGKRKAADLNMVVIRLAYDYAAKHYTEPCPYKVEPMDETEGFILMDGNAAGALGAVFGGLQMLSWYPITPSSSFADSAMSFLNDLRRTPEDGKKTYAVVQAEDELAAIGMVLGAGWAGARAMTCTSGPGISLMSEFAGMAYFAEVPSVIWDIQRVGPSTGLPTRTSQGDLLAAYTLGHGDSTHIVLLPANLSEAFEFGWRAFDYAERLQTLVMVLSDLDLGMNLWMSEPFEYPAEPMDRGKVLTEDELKQHIAEYKRWGRYDDVDGDGIGYRTLPGNRHPQAAYFTRGTGKDAYAIYSERSDVFQENMARLRRKFEAAREILPAPIVDSGDSTIGVLGFGTTDPAIREGRDMLAAQGMSTSYMRVRALPLHANVKAFVEGHDRVYVIENNYDGQLTAIMRMEYPELATKLIPVAHLDGLPFTADFVAGTLIDKEEQV